MIEGGCRCGAVRYTLRAEPVAARLCWCRDCQYWACGGPAANIRVPRSGLDVHGELAHYDSPADSSHRMRRSFCPRCGTQVTSQDLDNTAFMVVRIGTLDDPARYPPTAVIWTASAPPWAHIDPALQAFERQPG